MAYSKLQIAALHIKYGATAFKVEASFGDLNANPEAIDPRYLIDLARRGMSVGLDKSMIGKTIPTSHGQMTFQGMHASKAVVKGTGGKIWLYDALMVALLMRSAQGL